MNRRRTPTDGRTEEVSTRAPIKSLIFLDFRQGLRSPRTQPLGPLSTEARGPHKGAATGARLGCEVRLARPVPPKDGRLGCEVRLVQASHTRAAQIISPPYLLTYAALQGPLRPFRPKVPSLRRQAESGVHNRGPTRELSRHRYKCKPHAIVIFAGSLAHLRI